jgi:ABC-type sugar transport system permease subunit
MSATQTDIGSRALRLPHVHRRTKGLRWYRWYHPWLFLTLALVGLFVFRLYPMVAAFRLSFTSWDIMNAPTPLGFRNYVSIFTDPRYLSVLGNTVAFSAIYTCGVMALGLALAVLLNVKLRGITTFRALTYAPVVTSAVAVGIVWSWILSGRYGILNHALELVGIAGPNWLGERALALPAVATVHVWKMAGYYMTIFLAGLQEVPRNLYETADIDGATGLQKFRFVTLPMLAPFTFFVLIIAAVDSFNNFEIIYSMTRGGPAQATTTLVYSVFVNGFVFYRVGFATALAFLLMAIVGVFTAVNFRLRKRWAQPAQG